MMIAALAVFFILGLLPANLLWYVTGLFHITKRIDLIDSLLTVPNAYGWWWCIFDIVLDVLVWWGVLKAADVKIW